MVLTARPGRIKSIHDVSIPRPRDVRRLHENETYRRLLTKIGDELAEEIAVNPSEP